MQKMAENQAGHSIPELQTLTMQVVREVMLKAVALDLLTPDEVKRAIVKVSNRDGCAFGGSSQFRPYLSFPMKRFKRFALKLELEGTHTYQEYLSIRYKAGIGDKLCTTIDDMVWVVVTHEVAHAVVSLRKRDKWFRLEYGAYDRPHGLVWQKIYKLLRGE